MCKMISDILLSGNPNNLNISLIMMHHFHNLNSQDQQMRQNIIDTTRNTINQDTQSIQIIPQNDRLISPKNDKSLERRSKSISSSQLQKLINPQNIVVQKQEERQIPSEPQHRTRNIENQLHEQFEIKMNKYIQQNSRLQIQNQMLIKQNQTLNDKLKFNQTHQNQSEQNPQSQSQSYYLRIKIIQERISLYELQSRANSLYSECLHQISKCLLREQLTVNDLRLQITALMEQCNSYEEEIKSLNQKHLTKEYNMNQQLQKIIVEFNKAVFSKNDLEIKIFDLTRQNNALMADASDLKSKIQEQQYEIKKLSSNSSRMTQSRSMPRTQNSYQQLQINLEHYERENQHLKLEIETYITKFNHYHGSELNYKQEIGRLNNFIHEIDTKWNVEFEHNNTLQEERKTHLKEITKLSLEVKRLSLNTDQLQRENKNLKIDNQTNLMNKKLKQQELAILLQSLSKQRQNNISINSYNMSLQKQTKDLHALVSQLNDTIAEINKISQDKQNNYLHELNNLRGQSHELQNKIYELTNALILKQEQMRLISQQITFNNSTAIQFIQKQSKLDIEREKSNNDMLSQKIQELEQRILAMHQEGLNYASELSLNRVNIFNLQSKVTTKAAQYQQAIQRMQNTFNLERQALIHSKGVIETQLNFAIQQMQEQESQLLQSKQNHLLQYQNIVAINQNITKELQQNEFLIESLNKKLQFMDEIQFERNRWQNQCQRIEMQLNNKGNQINDFIKRTHDEQSVRKQSYQQQIAYLHQIIEKSEQQKSTLKRENEQNMIQMLRRQNEMRNNLMMKQTIIKQKSHLDDYCRKILEEFKASCIGQLSATRKQLVDRIKSVYEMNIQNQLQTIVNEYQQRCNFLYRQLDSLLNKQGISISPQCSEQVNLLKETYTNNLTKVKNDILHCLDNLRVNERINNSKLADVQSQIKLLEDMLRKISIEYSSQMNHHHQHSVQLELSNRQLSNMKQTNYTLTTLLSSSQQTTLTLRNQISNWSVRYDKLKIQYHESQNSNMQQIRSLKTLLSELEKQNHELTTRIAAAEHDKTIDRMNSMQDLNKSLQNHLSRVEINVGTQKDIRNRESPDILLVEDGQTVIKAQSNKIADKAGSGTQIIVNIIQKQQERVPILDIDPRSPTVNRNRQSFGVLPLIMNQQPNSPTHRVCFAARRRSRSPPIVIPQNIEIVKNNNRSNNSKFINEQQQFIARNPIGKIKQIPYIPITNEISRPYLKPTSPSINRIQTIKSSTSEPIIHYPELNNKSQLLNVAQKQKYNTSIFKSNVRIYTSNTIQQKYETNNSNSEIRY